MAGPSLPSLLVPLALTIPICNILQLNGASGKTEVEIYCYTQSLAVSPDASFDWKLLLIGIVTTKGIRKKSPSY